MGEARRRRRRRSSFARFPERSRKLLEPVTRATRGEAIAYAARRPFENVFLQWLLEGGLGPGVPDGLVLNRDAAGRPDGLAYVGAQLVLAADGDAALDAFAGEARRRRALRSLVGPKAAADGLWERIRDGFPGPVLVRTQQPLYLLRPGRPAPSPDPGVRPARESEAELVAEHSARMILGELGYDPRGARAGFAAAIRRSIAQGLWWVWVAEDGLRFQCNIGPRSAATAQLQGVWTPPEQRGKGYASVALSAIARRLLVTEATLTLYVNDFNTPAIALYERLGFVRVGTFATYLFP